MFVQSNTSKPAMEHDLIVLKVLKKFLCLVWKYFLNKVFEYKYIECYFVIFHTPILSHSLQGKKLQDISATQLLDLDTRTTEILSFKKINRGLFELDRFKDFPL